MGHLGFLYDQTRCIGCNACQMACKDKHNLEAGLFFRRVDTIEDNQDQSWLHVSGACNHCAEAACVKECPTGAMAYMEDGTVGHQRGMCIGCGTCTWVCPYGAPKLSRRLGIAMKCDACADARKEGSKPACVEACLTHCLDFCDLDEIPAGERAHYVSTLKFLPDAAQTAPSLLIRTRSGREERNYE